MKCPDCNEFICSECGNCICNLEKTWIDIKEALPKESGHYLVIADWMGVVEKAEFSKIRKEWSCPFGGQAITHWMPLPEAPPDTLPTP